MIWEQNFTDEVVCVKVKDWIDGEEVDAIEEMHLRVIGCIPLKNN